MIYFPLPCLQAGCGAHPVFYVAGARDFVEEEEVIVVVVVVEEEEEEETDLSSLSSAELKMRESILVFHYALMAYGMVLLITQGHGSTDIYNQNTEVPI